MWLLARIYGGIISLKNLLYDKKILKEREVDGVEIICIGNISVGGTGKTPAVQYFTRKLQEKGKKVAIVSRGYKGKRDHEPFLVSDGIDIKCTSTESGDEPYLHGLNLNDVPIVVGSSRYKACTYVVENFDVDVIILDDGFQHRKLKRDRDIVLIDGTNPYGGGDILPNGRLRESFRAGCKRASEFIITKSDLAPKEEIEDIKKKLEKTSKNVSVAIHKEEYLKSLSGDILPLNYLERKNIVLFSGLANPKLFEESVRKHSPEKITRVDFRDHHFFTSKDFESVYRKKEEVDGDIIITTEKDMVKFPSEIMGKRDIYILKIEFFIVEDNIETLKNI